MRPLPALAVPLLAALVLLTGCVEKFAGAYERAPEPPAPPPARASATPTGPELQALMQTRFAAAQRDALGLGPNLVRLVFDSPRVTLIDKQGSQTFATCRIEEDVITIRFDSAPDSPAWTLAIEPDGALTDAAGLRFLPVPAR